MFAKFLKWLALISLLLILAVGAACGYFYQWMDKQWQAPFTTETQLVHIEAGQLPYNSLNQVQGKIDSDLLGGDLRWVKLWLRINPALARIKHGSYKIDAGDSLSSIFARLSSGKEHQSQITLIEGETFKQWLKRLNQSDLVAEEFNETELLKQWGSPYTNIEGLLLPETYSYTLTESVPTLLHRSYLALNKVLEEEWNNRVQGLPYKTPYEALIMASIVEKESGVAHERPIIASVFVNRLRKRMRLQTDPTVIYGMGDRYDGNIRRKDLREATPYNTYVINGLPPTPIAMASLESIQAVLHPENTRFLYFVATGNNGEHYFSKSLKEHNRAVRKYIFKK